jgi:hypothetical protein
MLGRCLVVCFSLLGYTSFLGLKVVWIILRFAPIRIRILRKWRITFNINGEADNLNLLVCECKAKWIIHKFYVDYPIFRTGYSIISLPRLKRAS